MARLAGVKGWLNPEEAFILHAAAARFPTDGPLRVVEIGSWKGRSTIAIALGVAERGAGGVVHAVDPHRGSVPHRLLGEEDTFAQFVANVERAGVARVVDPIRASSEQARGQVPDASVHLLFVDGSHEHEDVLRDCDLWRGALAPGAWVAFHDAIASPGVAATLRERALTTGSPFRRPRLVEGMMVFDYRPAERWRPADTARAGAMRARIARLRAWRSAKAWVRRRAGRPASVAADSG